MSWGDQDSASARAVIRRARKGLDSRARRRVLRRGAKDPHTQIRVILGTEDEDRDEQGGYVPLWPFR